jgi:serine/threonine protein kinase
MSNHLPDLPSDYVYVLTDTGHPISCLGGHATVYKVRHTPTSQFYAVKVPHPGLEDILKNELKCCQQIGHNNHLTRLVDFQPAKTETPSRPLAIAAWSGRPLKQLCDQHQTLTPADFLRICLQSAQALSFVHSKGFLHRDISPSNLLFSIEHDLTTLIDLGLAISTGQVEQLCNSPNQHFTVDYVAPEIFMEGPQGYSIQSDIYSLAKTLLTLKIQLPPAQNQLIETLEKCTSRNPTERPTLAELCKVAGQAQQQFAQRTDATKQGQKTNIQSEDTQTVLLPGHLLSGADLQKKVKDPRRARTLRDLGKIGRLAPVAQCAYHARVGLSLQSGTEILTWLPRVTGTLN